MAQYTDLLRGTPVIADLVDLDSQKWALYSNWTPWPKSWIYRLEQRRLERYERALSKRVHCSLLRTEAECVDARRILGAGRFEVLANGVDLDYFDADAIESNGEQDAIGESARVVFTGVMDYFPNVQGVQFFCQEVLPLVRRDAAEVQFDIVGSRPDARGRTSGDTAGCSGDWTRSGRASLPAASMRSGCTTAAGTRHPEQGSRGDGHVDTGCHHDGRVRRRRRLH